MKKRTHWKSLLLLKPLQRKNLSLKKVISLRLQIKIKLPQKMTHRNLTLKTKMMTISLMIKMTKVMVSRVRKSLNRKSKRMNQQKLRPRVFNKA